jgi:hypothetical protein
MLTRLFGLGRMTVENQIHPKCKELPKAEPILLSESCHSHSGSQVPARQNCHGQSHFLNVLHYSWEVGGGFCLYRPMAFGSTNLEPIVVQVVIYSPLCTFGRACWIRFQCRHRRARADIIPIRCALVRDKQGLGFRQLTSGGFPARGVCSPEAFQILLTIPPARAKW